MHYCGVGVDARCCCVGAALLESLGDGFEEFGVVEEDGELGFDGGLFAVAAYG